MNMPPFVKPGFCAGRLLLLLAGVPLLGCTVPAGYNTYEGGLLGSAGGALIGAAIGAENGKPLQGAAIGAVAGGSLGSAAGNQLDRLDQEQQLRERRASSAAAAQALTLSQVVQLSQSGVGDQVIINQIHASGLARPVTTNDLVSLKTAGVSDSVIAAMQTAGRAAPASSFPAQPVIVEEHVYVAPAPFGPPHHYGGWHAVPPCRPRPRARFSVRF